MDNFRDKAAHDHIQLSFHNLRVGRFLQIPFGYLVHYANILILIYFFLISLEFPLLQVVFVTFRPFTWIFCNLWMSLQTPVSSGSQQLDPFFFFSLDWTTPVPPVPSCISVPPLVYSQSVCTLWKKPKTGHSTPNTASQILRGLITFFNLPEASSWLQLTVQLDFIPPRAHCWLMDNKKIFHQDFQVPCYRAAPYPSSP